MHIPGILRFVNNRSNMDLALFALLLQLFLTPSPQHSQIAFRFVQSYKAFAAT